MEGQFSAFMWIGLVAVVPLIQLQLEQHFNAHLASHPLLSAIEIPIILANKMSIPHLATALTMVQNQINVI